MRITKLTGHAIRILIECASSEDDLLKVAEISDRLGITRQNVFKVVNLMSHAGLVTPVRGPAGGVRLAKKADQIRIGDVVRILEQTALDIDAGAAPASARQKIAPLNSVIDEAFEAFVAVLDQHTLTDFVRKNTSADRKKPAQTTKGVLRRSRKPASSRST